jgi:hypothetical protein
MISPGELGFEEWVAWVFDNPVGYPAIADLADWGKISSPVLVGYLTSLFERADVTLAEFSNAQLSQSFWFLLGHGTDVNIALFDPTVPWSERTRCYRSILALFELCFARRCGPFLSHLGEGGDEPLNGLCYMWWDLFPTWGSARGPAGPDPVDAEILAVLAEILVLDSIACQESALHGLGHWALHHHASTTATIDDYLVRHPPARPELRRYAESARAGCVN